MSCVFLKMCRSRALLSGWALLLVQLLVQLRAVEAVPISMDKTRVTEPEPKAEEAPASVVRPLSSGDEHVSCTKENVTHSLLVLIL